MRRLILTAMLAAIILAAASCTREPGGSKDKTGSRQDEFCSSIGIAGENSTGDYNPHEACTMDEYRCLGDSRKPDERCYAKDECYGECTGMCARVGILKEMCSKSIPLSVIVLNSTGGA